MKKVLLLLAIAIFSTLILTSCGGSPIETAGAYTAQSEALIGNWDWNGQPYYVLNANGTGTMAGSAIRWAAGNGRLHVCVTPNMCGTLCPSPTVWNYELDGDNLNLSTRILSFNYTRR
ncbi:MAG: hypothetical protein FWE05_00770 [Defluviitaleaceae bacterium]|nr:hypothetical protein [Defluviitaleaceae bacterium]